MKNINIVQAIIFAVAGIAIVAAVILFTAYRGGGNNNSSLGTVVLWGTIPQSTFTTILNELSLEDESLTSLVYVEKNKDTFEDELLKALAEGAGPDLVLLNEKQIISNQRRMQEIPFESFPLRTYQDLFLDEGSLLVTETGILGFPFLVDPLVMYYNKDMLNNSGFARPPETWTELLAITPTMTQKDSSFNIFKSTIALGSFDNINNAKDIFWMLTLQAGNPVIERYVDMQQGGAQRYRSLFNDNLNFTLNPAYAATNFFVQFSNPTKTVYSWNRSLSKSQTMFVAGDLAFYIGYASELPTIKRINPNLNFDMALVPQSQNSSRKVTYGAMQLFMIPRATRNVSGAITMAAKLTSRPSQQAYSTALQVASVRRDMLATTEVSSPYQSIINRSAIIARGVLEPDSRQSSAIIKELIETVVSGQYEISVAITRAQEKLTATLNE